MLLIAIKPDKWKNFSFAGIEITTVCEQQQEPFYHKQVNK